MRWRRDGLGDRKDEVLGTVPAQQGAKRVPVVRLQQHAPQAGMHPKGWDRTKPEIFDNPILTSMSVFSYRANW
jgi:hypothetical protein